MNEKTCTKCKILKLMINFYKDRSKKDGYRCICKTCTSKNGVKYRRNNKEKIKVVQAKWYKKNKEKLKAIHQVYCKANKTKIQDQQRIYKEAHKEQARFINAEWYKAHKAERNEYVKKWCSLPKNKLRVLMSAAIRHSLKGKKEGRRWEDLVGYKLSDLAKRLKSTLPDGYTWNEYINGVDLHIDHIIPISAFNITSYNCTDFKRCWALKNLQLLPAIENLRKSDKIDKPFQPSLAGL